MFRVDPLSHTADVGYEVTADSLSELFRGAARGLVRAVGSEPPGGDGETDTLTLEGPDRERLMVAWLQELLYRMSRRGRPLVDADVTMTGLSSLRAELRWPTSGAPEPPEREVKGVTYHGLHVGEDEEGRWHARLVLDV